MYNMGEKGFMMGVALRCKVICKQGWRSPKLTQDGIREWVTVVETVSGDERVLRPMIINKGTAHYMGWYAGLKKKDLASFGISEKGWNTEKTGLIWLKDTFDVETRERLVIPKVLLNILLLFQLPI